MDARYIGRWLFTTDGAIEGFLRLEDGRVVEVCHGRSPEPVANSVVIPGFVDAHTHVGDSAAFPAPRGTVEEIVGPPDGHKHKVLRSMSRDAKIAAMKASVEMMRESGCSAFADFREEGLRGIQDLRAAIPRDGPRACILGRPGTSDPSSEEIDAILGSCDGFGVSAARDWPADLLRKLSRKAKSVGKLFALHASETVREDLDAVLDLSPDFLVHMNRATDDDLTKLADAGVPVVVCPRSNEFFGLEQDIPRLLRAGVHVALGTDNCMISRPDMFEEMRAALRGRGANGGIQPAQSVYLASWAGRKVLNAEGKLLTEIRHDDDLTVVRVGGADPMRELVTSAGTGDVLAIARGGEVWRSKAWMT